MSISCWDKIAQRRWSILTRSNGVIATVQSFISLLTCDVIKFCICEMSRVLKTQAQNEMRSWKAVKMHSVSDLEVCLSVESNAIAVYFSVIY